MPSRAVVLGRDACDALRVPTLLFHTSLAVNRASIQEHGLDWRRMANRGVAGNLTPEAEGVYLSRDRWEADWFAEMGGRDGHAIDIWQVSFSETFDPYEPPADLLIETDSGFVYHPAPIPPDRLTLVE